MKFAAYVHNKTLSDNNGGSLVLWHHLHALEDLGHETAPLLDLDEDIPADVDVIMFQSEWYSHLKQFLDKSNAKRICWIGHYKTHPRYVMPNISEIKADYYHTQWKGQCVDWGEKELGKKIHYLPHAACYRCNQKGEQISTHKALFIGADYPERKLDWLDHAGVARIACPNQEAKNHYRSALVCPNIHGDFQKNQVTDFFQIPGEMINDRIFNIIMSGGFAVSDDTPIVGEFFDQSMVHRCSDKDEFKRTIQYFIDHPMERLPYMSRARKHIEMEHTYTTRWEQFLKETGLCD